MLLLAHLVTQHSDWSGSQITVLTAVDRQDQVDDASAKIRTLLEAARIEADIDVVLTAGRPLYQVFGEGSGRADLVFLGFLLPTDLRHSEGFYRRIERITSGLPRTVLVSSARGHDFGSVVFDDTQEQEPIQPDEKS